MNYVALGRMSPDSIILWTCYLIRNTECLCYVFGSQNTMASVYGEQDDSRIPDLVCSHRLIKVQCYTGIKKIPRSHQVLHMVPLHPMERIPELWLKPEGSCVKAELGVEWPSPAIQITLNGWLSDHGMSDNHLRSHA